MFLATVFFALLISVASAQSELCSVCQLVVSYTESFIQKNESEQVIIQQLDALCSDLPLFGAQCVAIVAQYAPELITWIVNKENPQAFCGQVGLCSSALRKPLPVRGSRRQHNHRAAHQAHALQKHAVESEDQAACSICQLVVTYVEKWLAQNQTEAQIIQQLQAFCSNLGPLSPECSSFVASYAPQIITWLENKEPPSTICAQLGVCTSTRLLRGKATKALKTKRTTEQGACQICQLVVTYVENLVQQNNTVQEIEQKIDELCTTLPNPLNNLCTSIVNTYLPQLIQWIVNKEDPQAFCASAGLC